MNRKIGGFKELLGFFHSFGNDVLNRGKSAVLFEKVCEVIAGDIHIFADIFHAFDLAVIPVNIIACALIRFVGFEIRFVLFGEQTQNEVENNAHKCAGNFVVVIRF